MLKKGNAEPQNCVLNLTRCFRGEVPFERAKGLNRKFIGQPSVTAIPRLIADTKIMLKAYETAERIDIDTPTVKHLLNKEGIIELKTEVAK